MDNKYIMHGGVIRFSAKALINNRYIPPMHSTSEHQGPSVCNPYGRRQLSLRRVSRAWRRMKAQELVGGKPEKRVPAVTHMDHVGIPRVVRSDASESVPVICCGCLCHR